MKGMNVLEELGLKTEKHSRRQKLVQSFKARADAKRTIVEKLADWMTQRLGSVGFLFFNAIWFSAWISVNLGWIPAVEPFDPFPFGLMTMVVSLEAIFLAIIVLISQNREAKIADLREEIDLRVNMMAEEEISKIIELLSQLLKKHGIDVSHDPQVAQMIKQTSSAEIERNLEKELNSDS